MTRKINNYLIIITFLAAVLLPLIFSNKKGGEISQEENRYLAAFPEFFTSDKKLFPGIRSGIENWINDNAGGRSFALRINKAISFQLFGIFPEENVIEGKNKWLFLVPGFDIHNYVNSDLPTQEDLEKLINNFSAISSDLKSRNTEFNVMLWPHKFIIYPEYFPNTLTKVNSLTAIEILDKELTSKPGFDFETSLNALENGKQIRLVYYKAFDRSHWNQYGAFIGYRELMTQVQKHIPEIKILTEDDFLITSITRTAYTSLGFYTQEEDLQYKIKGGYRATSNSNFFNQIAYNSYDPWKSYNYFTNPNLSLPKAIIVGDSFLWMFMLQNMAESFSELVFIHYSDLPNLNDLINLINPDIVIMAGLGADVAYLFASYADSSSQGLTSIILSDTTPLQYEEGENYKIGITVKNVGSETWSENRKIRLAVFQDGFDQYRLFIPEDIEVKPGESYTFNLENFQGPNKDSLILEYQMVEEGVKYFGAKKRLILSLKNNTF